MKKEALVVLVLILVLGFTQGAIGQEKLMVPFGAIKSSCYGEIDMSKAEFPLSEIGEECVNQDWLEENLPSDSEEGTTVKKEKESKPNTSEEKEIVVPMDAVHVLKWRKARNLSEEQNRDDNKVKVPVSWVKPEWLKENRPEIETPLTLATKEPALEEIVEVINTPEGLVTFMKNYFRYKFHEGITAYSPEKFMKVKRGDCKDWAVFAEYILKENDYKAKRLAYAPEPHEGWHTITLYWLEDGVHYLTTHRNSIKRYGPFNNKEKALDNEGKRRTDFSGRPEVYTFCEPDRLVCPILDD